MEEPRCRRFRVQAAEDIDDGWQRAAADSVSWSDDCVDDGGTDVDEQYDGELMGEDDADDDDARDTPGMAEPCTRLGSRTVVMGRGKGGGEGRRAQREVGGQRPRPQPGVRRGEGRVGLDHGEDMGEGMMEERNEEQRHAKSQMQSNCSRWQPLGGGGIRCWHEALTHHPGSTQCTGAWCTVHPAGGVTGAAAIVDAPACSEWMRIGKNRRGDEGSDAHTDCRARWYVRS